MLVVAEHDYSPQLERLLARGRGEGVRQRRILELNAGHALVQGLRRRFDANPNDSVVGDYAELLLGWSLLAEGSEPHDPVRFTQLVAGLMETGLDAAPTTSESAPAEPAPSADESGSAQRADTQPVTGESTATEPADASADAAGEGTEPAPTEASASAD